MTLTVFGWICTAVVFVLIVLGEVGRLYEEKSNEEPFEIGGFALLNNLRTGVNDISDGKFNTLVSEIYRIKNSGMGVAPIIISNPSKQLADIARKMSDCLLHLLHEDKRRWKTSDLYVSISYRLPLERDEWYWATEERGLGLDELFGKYPDGAESTLCHLLRNKPDSIFCNSKADAEKNKYYIPDGLDERDADGKLLGSIACYRNSIKKNDITYIQYVLTVTTYDKTFAPENDPGAVDNIRHNMKDFVVSDFMKRIDTEMCLLYLSKLNETAGLGVGN